MKKVLILSVMLIFSVCAVGSAFAKAAPCPQKRKTKAAPGSIAKKKIPGSADAKRGKKLFMKTAKPMACKMCHGEKGDGKGTITHPVYSAIPAYFDDVMIRPRSQTTMKNLEDGHIYHAIYYGYNAMGPHYNLVSDEERWKIVLYVNELQNKEK